jgi:hypothetical protein
MKKTIIIILLLIAGTVQAADKWTTQDKILETTWLAIHIIDYGTTLDTTNYGNRYREINPILGEHPSRDKIHIYMIGTAILHPIVTHYLPRKVKIFGYDFPARTVFQSVTIGMSGGCVVQNLSVGLRLAF